MFLICGFHQFAYGDGFTDFLILFTTVFKSVVNQLSLGKYICCWNFFFQVETHVHILKSRKTNSKNKQRFLDIDLSEFCRHNIHD